MAFGMPVSTELFRLLVETENVSDGANIPSAGSECAGVDLSVPPSLERQKAIVSELQYDSSSNPFAHLVEGILSTPVPVPKPPVEPIPKSNIEVPEDDGYEYTIDATMTLGECADALVNMANELQETDGDMYRLILTGVSRQLDIHGNDRCASSVGNSLNNLAKYLRKLTDPYSSLGRSCIRAGVLEIAHRLREL